MIEQNITLALWILGIAGAFVFIYRIEKDHKRIKELQHLMKGQPISLEEFEELNRLLKTHKTNVKVEEEYREYLAALAQKQAVEQQEEQKARAKNQIAEKKKKEQSLRAKALQDDEKLARSLPEISVIDSATITKEVITQFDISKIIDLATFLSTAEIQKGIDELHSSLKPVYEEKIVKYFVDQTGDSRIAAHHVQTQVKICMAQGLKAIYQHEAFGAMNLVHGGTNPGGAKIQKARPWKEISGE